MRTFFTPISPARYLSFMKSTPPRSAGTNNAGSWSSPRLESGQRAAARGPGASGSAGAETSRVPPISVQLRGISSTLHHSTTKCPFSVLSVTPLLQCSFAGGVIWCLCRSRVAFYAGCNKGAAVGVLGILTKEARYFGQPANSHVAFNSSNDIRGLLV